jgi:hypothetical protein
MTGPGTLLSQWVRTPRPAGLRNTHAVEAAFPSWQGSICICDGPLPAQLSAQNQLSYELCLYSYTSILCTQLQTPSKSHNLLAVVVRA